MDALDASMLNTTKVLVLDCQASGASPKHGRVIEMAWCVVSAQQVLSHGTPSIHASLVALPEGEALPRRISQLTGITSEQLADAPPMSAIWAQLSASARAASEAGETRGGVVALTPTVIHFARYETPFLVEAHQGSGGETASFPLDLVCTHAIAQRLLPRLPRRGLRAVAGYWGCTLPELKRAAAHVEATAFVWAHLVRQLEQDVGIRTFSALRAWLAAKPSTRPSAQAALYRMPRERRLALPDSPGIYRMLGRNGHVLYVGKATSLKRRVNSYFQKRRGGAGATRELLSQVWDVAVEPMASPLEAALLESDVIKRLSPPYNVALKAHTRQLWWMSRSFELSQSPSPEHRWGPLPDARLASAVGRFVAWTKAMDGDDDDQVVEGFGLAPREGLVTRLREAVQLLAEAHSVTRWNLATVMRIGGACWPSDSARDGDESDDALAGDAQEGGDDADHRVVPTPSEDVDDSEGGLDADVLPSAEALVRWLEHWFARLAWQLRRARWMSCLSESTVAWQVPGAARRRVLTLAAGRCIGCGDLAPGEMVPVPPGHRRRRLARARGFDVATYDRLRVLTTELRRLVQRGDGLDVRLSQRAALGSTELVKLLSIL